jgi:DNA invertase Pin-like site-specific DNA recombinase
MRAGTTTYTYARKSTLQRNVTEDEKSVALQTENAVGFIREKHWPAPAADQMFADDAVSGTMTSRLKNRQRLIERILADRTPRRILAMRDSSRFSRRDGDHSFGELKRLAQAGVEIWYYQDGRQFKHGTFSDDVVGFIDGAKNREYVRQIATWTRTALVKKIKSGHVVGRSIFGYDNVRKMVGESSFVVREINEDQAAIVRRIFARAAAGAGGTRIVNELNAEGLRTVRQGPWTRGAVVSMLRRPIYYGGPVVYGRTTKKDADGDYKFTRRPEREWIVAPSNTPAIVSVEVWKAAAAHRQGRTDRMGGPKGGRLLDGNSNYRLTHFGQCGVCGGTMAARAGIRKDQGMTYICDTYNRKGPAACTNGTRVEVPIVDQAILRAILAEATPDADRILKKLVALYDTRRQGPGAKGLRADLERAERVRDRAAQAILDLGNLPKIHQAYRDSEATVAQLRADLAAADGAAPLAPLPNRATLQRLIRQRLETFTAELEGPVAATRDLFRRLLEGKIVFTPAAPVEALRPRDRRWSKIPRRDTRAFHFAGKLKLLPIFGGTIPQVGASSTGCGELWDVPFAGLAA